MQLREYMVVLVAVTLLVALVAPSGAAAEPVDWEEVEREDVPEEIAGWVEEMKYEQGVHLLPAGEYRYLLVAWGEKPTGGYAVEVTDVEDDRGTVRVNAELISPDPDDAVTQALTYPHMLLRLPAGDSPILVNFFGDVWREEELEDAMEGDEEIVLDPVLTDDELAPNPMVVRGWASVYEGTMEMVFEDGHIHLAEAHLTLVAAAPEWAEFEVALTYENPTSSVGTVYGAYEDPEDGSRVEAGAVSVDFGNVSRPMHDICGHWAEAAVRRAVSTGFIHGYVEDEERFFAPEEDVTRAEFVKMLVAAEAGEDPEVGDEELPFRDVAGHWSEPYVRWALEEEWIPAEELGDRLYPDEIISRGEMAYLAARASDISEVEDPDLEFTDAEDIPTVVKGWVAAAVDAGLLLGYDDGTFRADRGLNRAESVVVVWRVMGMLD